jgi:apolipoprotein N-acyltransferase
MKIVLLFLSFVVVAFGQAAWVSWLSPIAAAAGFAGFWWASSKFVKGRDRFFAGCLWFTAVQGVQLSWMATVDYMGPLILAVYFFLIVAMGVQFGLLSLWISPSMSWHRILAVAGLWTLFEWARLFFLCGFTWNPVGLSLAASGQAIQLASVWGVFGLSFWVILTNAVLLRRKWILWGALAIFPYGFGLVHEKWVERTSPITRTLNVALVQPAFLPEEKDFMADYPDRYIYPALQWQRILELLPSERKLDLIVFPEAALGMSAHTTHYPLSFVYGLFAKEVIPPLRKPLANVEAGIWKVSNAYLFQALANQMDTHVIVGMDDFDGKGRYNAAFHFSPQAGAPERYEKRVLVPVSEYMPLEGWEGFSQFIGEQFGIYSSFVPGTQVKIFNAPIALGVSICLEETFSELTRDLRKEGAEAFVNLTNDVWFPGTKLSLQHYEHGKIRAVENGVPVLRACNTGVTGVVDGLGKSYAELAPSEEKGGCLVASVPIRSHSTLYTLWGDAGILAISVAGLGVHGLLSRRGPKKKLP